MDTLGPHLASVLSEIAHRHYNSEGEYIQAIGNEYDKIIHENRSKMSPDDMELLSSTKAVLFWSYPCTNIDK